MSDQRSRHVWEFIETLLGPAIYLGFFGLVYLAGSFTCVLSRGNAPIMSDPQAAFGLSVGVLTLIALVMIAWFSVKGFRLLAKGREDPEDTFMGLVTLTLASLSALAVIWTAIPTATLPLTC